MSISKIGERCIIREQSNSQCCIYKPTRGMMVIQKEAFELILG
jgi:hypothetical protein